MSVWATGWTVRRSARALQAVLIAGLIVTILPGTAWGQEKSRSRLKDFRWQHGPCTSTLGGQAQIVLTPGYMFADAADARKLLELMENPTSGDELGIVAPEDFSWFVVYEFSDIGYVKDADKEKLDADAMLKSIQEGTKRSNEERKKRGWSTMTVVGWAEQPHYDPATNNLVWAIEGKNDEDGEVSVNYNTRRLGRNGVMEIALVVDPEELADVLPQFNQVMTGFQFSEGHRYGEFRAGDKIAKYGLTALITGGAAAVAVKTGLFKWLWKGIVVVVLAIGGAIKGIFGRRKESAG